MGFKARFPALALLVALIALPAFGQDNAASDEEKLAQLQAEIQKLKQELDDTKYLRDDLQYELQSSEQQIEKLNSKISQIEGDLEREKKQLAELTSRRAQLQQQRQQQQNLIAQELASAYRLGSQGQLKLLLNQQQPEKFSRIMRYFEYVVSARSEKLAVYRQTLDEINRIEPRIATATAELERNRHALAAEQATLASQQKERKTLLARLLKSIKDKDKALSMRMQDREHLQKLLAGLGKTVRMHPGQFSGPSFASLKGKLAWPVAGQMREQFGSARLDGRMKWQGVVIAAREGTPVAAVHSGRVIFANYLRGQGQLLIVDHGDGFMSLYAHNQQLEKKVGDWVEAGEIIAKVGVSGGLESAALYFEIRQDGKPANPAQWCRG